MYTYLKVPDFAMHVCTQAAVGVQSVSEVPVSASVQQAQDVSRKANEYVKTSSCTAVIRSSVCHMPKQSEDFSQPEKHLGAAAARRADLPSFAQ